jgi:SAM-dependent methyltransferase
MAMLVEVEEDRIRAAYARRHRDERYSWFNDGHLLFIQSRERRFIDTLKRTGLSALETLRILEIGCGNGYWLREFVKWGACPANLTGVDLMPDRVAEAKQLCPNTVSILCRNAADTGLPSESFDIVFQSTVFTSILDPAMKRSVADEMLRCVKPGGHILWYDFHVDNPWNVDVRGVKKREIWQLFPACKIELTRLTLAPPVIRYLAPWSWSACHLLEKVPLFCTHYLGVIRKTGR